MVTSLVVHSKCSYPVQISGMYAINHKCSSFVVDWLSLFMPVYFFLLKYNRFPAHSAFSAAFFAVFLAGFFSSSPSVFSALAGFSALALSTTTAMAFSFRS